MVDSPSLLLRPSLGQSPAVGALYNAHADRILDQSVFIDPPSVEVVTTKPNPSARYELAQMGSTEQKFSKLGVGDELAVSFLCDLVTVGGSGKWLQQAESSVQEREASVLCISTINRQYIDWNSTNNNQDELRSLIDITAMQDEDATHVVCGIHWGARTVITTIARTGDKNDERLQSILDSIGNVYITGAVKDLDKELGAFAITLDFKIHADLFPAGPIPTTYSGVCQYLSKVPQAIKKFAGGKGRCLAYELVPIAEFAQRLQLDFKLSSTQLCIPVEPDCLREVISLFAAFTVSKQRLHDCLENLTRHLFCIPAEHLDRVKKQVKSAGEGECAIKAKLAQKVKEARQDGDSSRSTELRDALTELRDSPDSPERIAEIVGLYDEKMQFADEIVAAGARYGSVKEAIMASLTTQERSQDLYILHYSKAALVHPDWEATRLKLKDLLSVTKTTTQSVVMVIDYDMHTNGATLEAPRIQHERQGQVTRVDMVSDAQELAGTFLLRYRPDKWIKPDPSVRIPFAERLLVTIPCPWPACPQNAPRDWICPVCEERVYFWPVDKYLHCQCGEYHPANAQFQCQLASHGPQYFTPSNSTVLTGLLQACHAAPQYNILILSEIGVGKSTFINSLINYLQFDSLDDAMKDEGELRSVEYLSYGGQSATQQPVKYQFNLNGKIIQLIDTPGIGDVRGLDKDYENFQNILKTLESVDKLSTILFLMKPNSARPSSAFDFCHTELLSHLHKDSSRNIVFGFTNSRSANYSPGETRAPLERLLKKGNTDIPLPLDSNKLFFFDSESFLFLAAYKLLGQERSGKSDCVASWEKSAQEAHRLIATTFKIPAQQVNMTLRLNRTRQLITSMTVPTGTTPEATPTKEEQAELEHEDKEIREALATFGAYLNNSAMVAYNDATIRYLDYMISQAAHQAQVEKKAQLEAQKAVNQAEVTRIRQAIESKTESLPTEDNIDAIVAGLKKLLHFGPTVDTVMGPGSVFLTERKPMEIEIRRVSGEKKRNQLSL
ncbi:uncharacterized protein TRIVIDRAFT_70852 [Trichoderma virens Gv29-8]|uniref:Uncharacterized protein n=1 Tax=Hypocrea virens (strain Gv29-8 / FGSC 10586) TaxID=413071 RepID=G9MUG3_HYPVG|nr:uncharacterized protein TRIVIDRAFT_70852 [Trichoderma virens Gv29-8]EHK21907.1 hypothetical protein TRIVIDRAFT_70852 [Trichoderma virens Gv29-8]UKZ54358.1 hypothetical protein TrVGV298_008166 [Trichoderma virens]